jgi:hypothetical protein
MKATLQWLVIVALLLLTYVVEWVTWPWIRSCSVCHRRSWRSEMTVDVGGEPVCAACAWRESETGEEHGDTGNVHDV